MLRNIYVAIWLELLKEEEEERTTIVLQIQYKNILPFCIALRSDPMVQLSFVYALASTNNSHIAHL